MKTKFTISYIHVITAEKTFSYTDELVDTKVVMELKKKFKYDA